MNELTTYTKDELSVEVNDIDRRKAKLKTAHGLEEATHKMLGILRGIEASGYPTKTDIAEMAFTWTSAMSEQIAVYRIEGIKKAVMEFIRTDTREYKQFPSIGQIIDICEKIGMNPRAELARREQEEYERLIKAERDTELASLPADYKKQCMERYKHLWKGEK